MPFAFTAQDILYAAVLALVFTWLIKTVARVFRMVVTHSTEFSYTPNNKDAIMEKCCNMFPNEFVKINGTTFRRGMSVAAITSQHKTIEGQFIGSNSDNMICFITEQCVVAHEIDNIEEMWQL